MVEVPSRTASLRLRLRFTPAQVNRIRNLVTFTLFGPEGFRGAGHRHAPEQEVTVSLTEATPGFLPGPLFPGLWTVELDLHAVLETSRGEGLSYELEVDAEQAPETDPDTDEEVPEAAPVEMGVGDRTSPPAPLPAGEGSLRLEARPLSGDPVKRWLKGDLHVHSNHSDGRWSIDDVVEYIRRNALDYVALTDHNTTSGREHLVRALAEAGLDTIVIPAMELTTFWGHANALGVSEWIDWRVRGPEGKPARVGESSDAPLTGTFEAAARGVLASGGLFVVNHPRSPGYPVCTGCRWEMGDASTAYATAIEVMNGPWPRPQNDAGLALWDRWLNAGHRIPATAGSDSHGFPQKPEQIGFTFAMASPDVWSILDAVRDGRTFLSRGPAIEWLPRPDVAAPLGVRLGELGDAVDVCLVASGERSNHQRVSQDGEVWFDVPPGQKGPRWYRVEAYAKNKQELLALTNPVWVD